MIDKIDIKNFKAIQNLEIELGRINVFIGENGCGKTSILEAIALGSAATQNKLDSEFLVNRGVRVVDGKFMKSAFKKENSTRNIFVGFTNKKKVELGYEIHANEDIPYNLEIVDKFVDDNFKTKVSEGISQDDMKGFVNQIINHTKEIGYEFDEEETVETIKKKLSENFDDYIKDIIKTRLNEIVLLEEKKYATSSLKIDSFLIYAPENFFLRRFEEEGQIKPLGIRGEGLFSHLVELSKKEPDVLKKISENLKLIEWFDELEIPDNLNFSERRITIKDKYISDEIGYIDQRSSNEGFLYLLFYVTLFLSKHTPNFFAIDNLDNSLNPKLCQKLLKTLTALAEINDKQVILTTHNPAILDGLNLENDDQRLFVVYRNMDGETNAKRIHPPKKIDGVETPRLSEAFVRGYLGGLPKNF